SRTQVVEVMRRCDVFVLPSRYETFGVVSLEALSCGKPVVATRCGGPESVVNDTNGLLVPPGDRDALGQALCRVAENLRHYDPARIRSGCIASFGRKAVVNRLAATYRRVTNGSGETT